jgi:hypothetical protein
MSGKSNVVFWLERHGVPADEELVERILPQGEDVVDVLTESEIEREIRAGAHLRDDSPRC